MNGPRTVTLIVTDQALRGEGKDKDPIRRLHQLFTLDGRLVAEYDVHAEHLSTVTEEIATL